MAFTQPGTTPTMSTFQVGMKNTKKAMGGQMAAPTTPVVGAPGSELNTFSIAQNAQMRSTQGSNMLSRGTGLGHAPTMPTQMAGAVKPATGVTPLGTNKGPMKQVGDNLMNTHARKTQAMFNTGPNKGIMEKGLAYNAGSPDSMGKGFMGNMMTSFKRVFQEDDEHKEIGRGVKPKVLFSEK